MRALGDARSKRERAAAARAERFLARASTVLAESLDYDTTLARVAELAVPEIADWCVVDVLDDEGVTLRPVALAHVDPDKVKWAAELRRRYPAPRDAPRGPERVARSGQSELVAEVRDEDLVRVSQDEHQLQLLRGLGVRSYIGVPLRAHGAVLGALSLVSSRPDRAYGPGDLVFAEELARRAALAVDNARLYARAQEAIRLRDDFLAVASHELRTPLTTLQLQLQSLHAAIERRPPGAVDNRDATKVKRAVRSTERLAALVNSLVDVSRISSGHLDLARESVDLGEVARQIADRFGEEARRVACEIGVLEEGSVVGQWDRLRIEQIFTNLLSNALKYGPGRPVEISLRARAGWAELAVRDHGIGIEAEHLDRIFGRFERAVSVRHFGGLGLGLYITRQIAESHGGSIEAESAPGAGAVFTVRLPLAAPNA